MRTVLSLFDGMSCGRLALNRAGIHYERYVAAETDRHAIAVSTRNFPDTIHVGDVSAWRGWDIDWSTVDLILAGSPCQGFSFAGKGLAFENPRSKLFFTFVDILRRVQTVNPSVNFLLENVTMTRRNSDTITEILGVEPVSINSALVSAQNRNRLYWASWRFKAPPDAGVTLKHIVEEPFVGCARIVGRRINPETGRRDDYNPDVKPEQRIELRPDEKSETLTTVQKDNVLVLQRPRGKNAGGYKALTGKTPTLSANAWEQNNYLVFDKSLYRKFTPEECEALQTVPRGFTAGVAATQRYRLLGNGWTIDVISHILGSNFNFFRSE